jgi:DNA repair protein SbcD/Mre11
MKYAHLADLHLGSWRAEKMRDLSTKTFLKAINNCIKDKVNFILFSGDIFNTSLPAIDTLKLVTEKLKELKDKGIPIYVIAGSHDFSPSGKTMIEVLEKAGLVTNVCKGQVNPETKELQLNFTIDLKTNAKLTGIIGRRGLLDKTYYENLARTKLESEPGYKIFMFHTTVTEMVPEHLSMIESQPASFFPKGFNYYAGGHIHHPTKITLPEYGPMTYPGALFPNNFAELEKYGKGGYYLITIENQQQTIAWIPLEIIKHVPIKLEFKDKSPEEVKSKLFAKLNEITIKNSVITIKLKGKLQSGKVSDINFNDIFKELYRQGAYFVMKNTVKLHSEEFEEIKSSNSNPEIIEEKIIKEHLQQIKLFNSDTEMYLTKSLLSNLNTSKKEGETITDFQKRIQEDIERTLKIN